MSEVDADALVNYIEDDVLDGHVQLNKLLDIMPNGNLIIRNAYNEITGFYECILQFGNNSKSMEVRKIRHQIEGTSCDSQ